VVAAGVAGVFGAFAPGGAASLAALGTSDGVGMALAGFDTRKEAYGVGDRRFCGA
jgi:hypothetical protein